jgi:hypothetical protein
VNVCPPAVIVPVRGDVEAFACTEYVTGPSPFPFAPASIVIHPTLLAAFHAQPVVVSTSKVAPLTPGAPTEAPAGDKAKLQAPGVPAWVSVNVCPAIARVPTRWIAVGLGATVYATVSPPRSL